MASVFWDSQGILFIHFLIKQKNPCSLLFEAS